MIDLDALRAARREVLGAGPTVTFGGRTFQLPSELPFEVPESLAEVAAATEAGDSAGVTTGVRRAISSLFGADYEEFMALAPSMADIQELLAAVIAEYGLGEDVGESSASE